MSEKSPLATGDSQAYIDALLAFLGDREPLEVFAETPQTLRTTAEAIPDGLLRIPEAPGKWSVLHVLQHLAQVEFVLGFRYRKVLAEDGPSLPAIAQDAWVDRLYPEAVGRDEALADFVAVRQINLHLLRRVTGDAWARHGMHTQRGKETLGAMVRLYAAHDLYHLHQIERILQTVRR